jgi:glycosyltransferase involved in cell wall biosynthesis
MPTAVHTRRAHTGRLGHNKKRSRIGILDQAGCTLGGAQLVVGHMASVLSPRYDVEIINPWDTYSVGDFAMVYGLDLTNVSERKIRGLTGGFAFDGVRSLICQKQWTAYALTRPYDLFIYSGTGIPPLCFAKHALVYCHFPFESSPLDWLLENGPGVGLHRLPHLVRVCGYKLLWRKRMQAYQRILTNSQFTASWIQRRWGECAEVLHPPVDLELPVVEKRNIIVSVGRFVGRGRSKNQLEQVIAFREFIRRAPGDWRLRMIGCCGEATEDQAYVENVRGAALGLPVEFLLDVDRKVITESLAEAKLFWHTTGIFNDDMKQPGLAEHFGIATVEAMRAGCVPIVIASGGQAEIIEDGTSGFLARDLPELVKKSLALVADDKRFSLRGQHAIRRSLSFSRNVFEQRFTSIVSQCLSHPF